MGKRRISSEEVKNLKFELSKINASISKNTNEELIKLYSEFEKDFIFVGASAVEDKLQEVLN